MYSKPTRKSGALIGAVNTVNTVNTLISVNIVNIANIVDFNAMGYKKQYNDSPQILVSRQFYFITEKSQSVISYAYLDIHFFCLNTQTLNPYLYIGIYFFGKNGFYFSIYSPFSLIQGDQLSFNFSMPPK